MLLQGEREKREGGRKRAIGKRNISPAKAVVNQCLSSCSNFFAVNLKETAGISPARDNVRPSGRRGKSELG